MVLMLLSIVALYFYTSYVMTGETEEELYSRQYRLENYLQTHEQPIKLEPVFNVEKVSVIKNETIKDTLIYDPSQQENEMFRELKSYKTINGQDYEITVRSMKAEAEDIVLGILFAFVVIIVLIFIIQYYFSQAWNKVLWKPFFNNLDAMKGFSLKSNQNLDLEDSDILEFSELKEEIDVLTRKVTSDYQNLKQFTEDVSHELQTPLAIMQAKIENLLDSEHINAKQFADFSSLQKDIQRLAQLNKKLVLLTKLENQQFQSTEKIELKNLVSETVDDFKELSKVPIHFTAEQQLIITADANLMEILVRNLVSNAVKYCAENGEITVELKDSQLVVRNSGNAPIKHPEKLFSRFYKESKNQKSNGLGLAIVKKICDKYGFGLNYDFREGKHVFQVNLKIRF